MVGFKRVLSVVAVGLLSCMVAFSAFAVDRNEKLKSFVLAYKGPGELAQMVEETKAKLEGGGFDVVGEYSPYKDVHIIIVTNKKLQSEAKKVEYGGFGAMQRVAVVMRNDEIQVSYANPIYISQAYRFKDDLSSVREQLGAAIGDISEFGNKGKKARKLRKYHYTFGMEYFDEPYELAEFDSYAQAVKMVDRNLSNNNAGVGKVYRLDIPGSEMTVFGVSRKAGPTGDKFMDEEWIMSNVDFRDLSMAAYLPYEILVNGNEVLALHMRFRMAVHTPDLKMMGSNSFMNLMQSPTAIEKALTDAVNGK